MRKEGYVERKRRRRDGRSERVKGKGRRHTQVKDSRACFKGRSHAGGQGEGRKEGRIYRGQDRSEGESLSSEECGGNH